MTAHEEESMERPRGSLSIASSIDDSDTMAKQTHPGPKPSVQAAKAAIDKFHMNVISLLPVKFHLKETALNHLAIVTSPELPKFAEPSARTRPCGFSGSFGSVYNGATNDI
ncbi:hypothetical protein BDV59DRAFT_171073 [Aspergillus ambiguus]|uniref:uncharacterized protein n=1 Tax=Aspergillus ambiguus TaxID=176160 RepID=UPI003CCDC82C